MVNFSVVIKELRESKHMTQSELVSRSGVTKSMISSYETAIRAPSYEVLIKLAGFFNVSMDYIFGFSNDSLVNIDGLSDKEKMIIRELIETFEENKR